MENEYGEQNQLKEISVRGVPKEMECEQIERNFNVFGDIVSMRRISNNVVNQDILLIEYSSVQSAKKARQQMHNQQLGQANLAVDFITVDMLNSYPIVTYLKKTDSVELDVQCNLVSNLKQSQALDQESSDSSLKSSDSLHSRSQRERHRSMSSEEKQSIGLQEYQKPSIETDIEVEEGQQNSDDNEQNGAVDLGGGYDENDEDEGQMSDFSIPQQRNEKPSEQIQEKSLCQNLKQLESKKNFNDDKSQGQITQDQLQEDFRPNQLLSTLKSKDFRKSYKSEYRNQYSNNTSKVEKSFDLELNIIQKENQSIYIEDPLQLNSLSLNRANQDLVQNNGVLKISGFNQEQKKINIKAELEKNREQNFLNQLKNQEELQSKMEYLQEQREKKHKELHKAIDDIHRLHMVEQMEKIQNSSKKNDEDRDQSSESMVSKSREKQKKKQFIKDSKQREDSGYIISKSRKQLLEPQAENNRYFQDREQSQQQYSSSNRGGGEDFDLILKKKNQKDRRASSRSVESRSQEQQRDGQRSRPAPGIDIIEDRVSSQKVGKIQGNYRFKDWQTRDRSFSSRSASLSQDKNHKKIPQNKEERSRSRSFSHHLNKSREKNRQIINKYKQSQSREDRRASSSREQKKNDQFRHQNKKINHEYEEYRDRRDPNPEYKRDLYQSEKSQYDRRGEGKERKRRSNYSRSPNSGRQSYSSVRRSPIRPPPVQQHDWDQYNQKGNDQYRDNNFRYQEEYPQNSNQHVNNYRKREDFEYQQSYFNKKADPIDYNLKNYNQTNQRPVYDKNKYGYQVAHDQNQYENYDQHHYGGGGLDREWDGYQMNGNHYANSNYIEKNPQMPNYSNHPPQEFQQDPNFQDLIIPQNISINSSTPNSYNHFYNHGLQVINQQQHQHQQQQHQNQQQSSTLPPNSLQIIPNQIQYNQPKEEIYDFRFKDHYRNVQNIKLNSNNFIEDEVKQKQLLDYQYKDNFQNGKQAPVDFDYLCRNDLEIEQFKQNINTGERIDKSSLFIPSKNRNNFTIPHEIESKQKEFVYEDQNGFNNSKKPLDFSASGGDIQPPFYIQAEFAIQDINLESSQFDRTNQNENKSLENSHNELQSNSQIDSININPYNNNTESNLNTAISPGLQNPVGGEMMLSKELKAKKAMMNKLLQGGIPKLKNP